MIRRITLTLTLAAAVWLATGTTAQAGPLTFSFSLLPGADIVGGPGDTIGWGYTVTNESADEWLELTNISADPFLFALADSSIFDYAILAPGEVHSVAYSPGLAGLFQLTWDPTAPLGTINAGTFVLSGSFWDADPLLGANFVGSAPDQSALYSATVASATPVPEPATLLLMGTGAASLLLRRRRPHAA